MNSDTVIIIYEMYQSCNFTHLGNHEVDKKWTRLNIFIVKDL